MKVALILCDHFAPVFVFNEKVLPLPEMALKIASGECLFTEEAAVVKTQ